VRVDQTASRGARRSTPATYTGQDLVELHLISSPPLVDLLVATLLEAGARDRVLDEAEERLGVPMVEAYGMTEAGHQMTSNPLPPAARVAGGGWEQPRTSSSISRAPRG